MSNLTLQQEWESILIEQSSSGLSKKAFCEQRGLHPATFYYWQRRLRKRDEDINSGFQRVVLQQAHELTVCLADQEVVLRSKSSMTLGLVIKSLIDA